MLRLPTRLLLALSPLMVAGAAAAQLRWTPLGALPRTVSWPVFDTARGRVIAFGAYGQVIDDRIRAFEWNGRWQLHQQASDSGLGTIAGAVFDRTRAQALVVGRASIFSPSPSLLSVYEGGRFHTIPSMPVNAAAGYVDDVAHGEVLAFGGSAPSFAVVDTMWRWDGSAWTAVVQPALRPSARQGPALVFDPLRGRVVLFGGSDGVRNPFGDTWTWDGLLWQQVATTGPAPRERAGFAFDPPSGACLLHGGYVREQEVAGTWSWDGTAWTQVTVPGSPGSGWLVETADRPLLLREDLAANNGTFRWNGAAGFVPVAAPQNALARYETELVYDAARGELVQFGGQPIAGGLWLWNGAWRRVGLSAPGPVARRRHSMVYDALRQQVVLFGGQDADVGGVPLGDTWTWDGVAWTQHVAATTPGPRFESGFAYDAARGQCVLFGGTTFMELGDTWLWDGVAWTQAQPAVSPPRRWNPGMAYDEQRQRVVLLNGMVGGTGLLDQWEWDGSAWSQQFPLVQPSGVIGYHRQLGRVVVVTGFGAIHAWDGAQWQPVPVFSPIGERPAPLSVTWHDGLDRMVLYSGGVGDQTLWALTATPPLVETYGQPCPAGTTNDCDLLALGLPQLGNDRFELDLRGSAANTYGAVLWGHVAASFPIGGGCALLVDPFVSQLVFMNGAGYSALRVGIPVGAAFLGASVRAQGFVLDGTGPVGGVSASAGLRLQLGR